MDAVAHETSERLCRALGEAVVRMWGRLPQDLQERLFRDAARSEATVIRPQLAMFLHDKHPRTCAARQARAMLEPDCLGG
jgi:hypothetical protein